MEAKVDVRKLQILNDRINQTIEALNQVRLSVHGLGSGIPFGLQQFGQGGFPIQQQGGLSHSPIPFQPFGAQQPFGMPQGYGLGLGTLPFQPSYLGLSHSPFNPLQQWYSPFQQGFAPLQEYSPLQQGYGTQSVIGSNPLQNPWLFSQFGGFQHSSPKLMEQRVAELRACDPNRIALTFPYISAVQSPFTTVV